MAVCKAVSCLGGKFQPQSTRDELAKESRGLGKADELLCAFSGGCITRGSEGSGAGADLGQGSSRRCGVQSGKKPALQPTHLFPLLPGMTQLLGTTGALGKEPQLTSIPG